MIKYSVNHTQTTVRQWKFPDGCVGVDIQVGSQAKDFTNDLVKITCIFGSEGFTINDDIIALAMVVDAVKRQYPVAKLELELPYIPYSRQDRAVNAGEPNSLKVIGKMINAMGFSSVFVLDAHSIVADACIDNMVEVTQLDIFRNIYPSFRQVYVVAPDAGASKKCETFAKAVGAAGVITCAKERDPHTGKIVGLKLLDSVPEGANILVLDDLCDGGRTFIEVSQLLEATGNVSNLDLAVTHGLFSKGVDVVAKNYDTIYTTDSIISDKNNGIVRIISVY
jgi:ribose-phosphate pyrophosphokinase